MSDAAYARLRLESGGGEVGARLYALLIDVAADVVRRYPPRVYTPTREHAWSDDAIRALVHECTTRQMRPDQVRLLFDYADDLPGFRAGLARRLRQTLRDIRAGDVVDNVLGRVRSWIEAAPGTVTLAGRVVPEGVQPRDPTEAELASVAREISLVRRLKENPVERAPRVYSAGGVEAIARALLGGLPGGVGLADVDRVLRRVLADLTVAAILPEDDAAATPTQIRGPAEEAEVMEAVTTVLTELTEPEQELLDQVMRGWTDRMIAERRGGSRSGAHGARQALHNRLRPLLEDVDPDLVDQVMAELGERLRHER